jgi:hypothetical protein
MGDLNNYPDRPSFIAHSINEGFRQEWSKNDERWAI